MTDARRVIVYSRQGCHLCELLIEQLLPLTRGSAIVEVIDVDRDAQLALAYGTRVPVVEVDGIQIQQVKRMDNRSSILNRLPPPALSGTLSPRERAKTQSM